MEDMADIGKADMPPERKPELIVVLLLLNFMLVCALSSVLVVDLDYGGALERVGGHMTSDQFPER